MQIATPRLLLVRISAELARRIVAGDPGDEPGDAPWHPEYPFADELDPLRQLANDPAPDPVFTLYQLVRRDDGRAIGGLGFFGPPDRTGRVEFGYGLVPSARGAGLATEAVLAALGWAGENGATAALAETEVGNTASQRVLTKAGLCEVSRNAQTITFRRTLGPERPA